MATVGSSAARALPAGVLEFWDRYGVSRHGDFQKWRRAHDAGAVLAFTSLRVAVLHGARCPHFSKSKWRVTGGDGSLTNHRKLAADDTGALRHLANQTGISLRECHQCRNAGLLGDAALDASAAAGAEESSAQLNESLDAAEQRALRAIDLRTDLEPEQKRALRLARFGHDHYRRNVEKIESRCRVTGLLDRRHVRACHIKSWLLCDDCERLDGFNGLLLSPHVAQLFERGHLSFADDGALLISRYLNPAVLESWKIDRDLNVGAFRPEQCVYLEYHRRFVFERPEPGRSR